MVQAKGGAGSVHRARALCLRALLDWRLPKSAPVEIRALVDSDAIAGDGLRKYLTTFHETLIGLSERLSAEQRRSVFHGFLLPAKVFGYVSRQFGLAVEYIPPEPRTATDVTTYEMIEGDDRVEDLIFADAPRFFRSGPPAITIQGGRWWITGIHFAGGPFRIANNPDTHVVFDRCLFSSDPQALLGWWKGTAVLEVFGDRGSHLWTPDRAIVRAQQEVLTALFESQRAREKNVSVADYIANYREKAVLVLGSYSDSGSARLEEIRHHLRGLGYDAVLLRDMPDQAAQIREQKLVTYGSLVRFVVMDDSERSGHLAELPICRNNGWITILLHAGGRASSAMSEHASILSNVMLEVNYVREDLALRVQEAARWAEEKRVELHRQLQHMTGQARPPVPPSVL
jgi:hypothetical protein